MRRWRKNDRCCFETPRGDAMGYVRESVKQDAGPKSAVKVRVCAYLDGRVPSVNDNTAFLTSLGKLRQYNKHGRGGPGRKGR